MKRFGPGELFFPVQGLEQRPMASIIGQCTGDELAGLTRCGFAGVLHSVQMPPHCRKLTHQCFRLFQPFLQAFGNVGCEFLQRRGVNVAHAWRLQFACSIDMVYDNILLLGRNQQANHLLLRLYREPKQTQTLA